MPVIAVNFRRACRILPFSYLRQRNEYFLPVCFCFLTGYIDRVQTFRVSAVHRCQARANINPFVVIAIFTDYRASQQCLQTIADAGGGNSQIISPVSLNRNIQIRRPGSVTGSNILHAGDAFHSLLQFIGDFR